MIFSRPRLPTRESIGKLKPAPFPPKQILTHVATNVSVSWGWYDQSQGVVQWTFKNSDSKAHSVILLRNGYYFGGAFWPVYYANSNGRGASATNPADNFGVDFLDGSKSITPLVDNGVTNNSAPLALVGFNIFDVKSVSTSNSVVCFIFTIAPNTSWSILEGGFTEFSPSGISLYEVTPLVGQDFCIGYDQQRVVDWDLQTQTNLQGYSPNPSTFNTWLLLAESDAPFDVLPYNDSYSAGPCVTPSPSCSQYLEQALNDFEEEKYDSMLKDITDWIQCKTTSGWAQLEDKEKKSIEGFLNRFKELMEHM